MTETDRNSEPCPVCGVAGDIVDRAMAVAAERDIARDDLERLRAKDARHAEVLKQWREFVKIVDAMLA